jgi:hypothetical protein
MITNQEQLSIALRQLASFKGMLEAMSLHLKVRCSPVSRQNFGWYKPQQSPPVGHRGSSRTEAQAWRAIWRGLALGACSRSRA